MKIQNHYSIIFLKKNRWRDLDIISWYFTGAADRIRTGDILSHSQTL